MKGRYFGKDSGSFHACEQGSKKGSEKSLMPQSSAGGGVGYEEGQKAYQYDAHSCSITDDDLLLNKDNSECSHQLLGTRSSSSQDGSGSQPVTCNGSSSNRDDGYYTDNHHAELRNLILANSTIGLKNESCHLGSFKFHWW